MIPPVPAQHLPDNLTHDVAAPGKHGVKHAKGGPPTAAPRAMHEKRVDKSAEVPKPEVKDIPEMAPKVQESAVEELPEATAVPAPPPVIEDDPIPDGLSDPADEGITVPTSRSQLRRLSKVDAYDLAVELGVDVPTAADISVKELRRLLAPRLGL